METKENKAVNKIIEEYKNIETEYLANIRAIENKKEDLEEKRNSYNRLKKDNKKLFQSIAQIKTQIKEEKEKHDSLLKVKDEYDKYIKIKNDLINQEKNMKSEISQKNIKIKRMEYETRKIGDTLKSFKDSQNSINNSIGYERDIEKKEEIIKEMEELKLSTAYLKKENKNLQKEIEEMNYILNKLEDSVI